MASWQESWLRLVRSCDLEERVACAMKRTTMTSTMHKLRLRPLLFHAEDEAAPASRFAATAATTKQRHRGGHIGVVGRPLTMVAQRRSKWQRGMAGRSGMAGESCSEAGGALLPPGSVSLLCRFCSRKKFAFALAARQLYIFYIKIFDIGC